MRSPLPQGGIFLSARKGTMDNQRILMLALETLAARRAEVELEIEAIQIIRKAEISVRVPTTAAHKTGRKRRKAKWSCRETR